MASRSLWRSLPAQQLFWSAGGAGSTQDAAAAAAQAGATIGPVLCLEELPSAACLKLEIPFFTKAQLGAAHLRGPLDLNTIFTFCAELREKLKVLQAETNPAAVCLCCSQRSGAVANSLLLLGAFLVLEKQLAALDVLDLMFGPDNPGGIVTAVEQRFPTPFSGHAQFSKDSLSVQDCLFGLDEAVQRGWLDLKLLDTKARKATSLACDAVEVFQIGILPMHEQSKPTKRVAFWVAADPVTTVVDPAPRADPPSELAIDDIASNSQLSESSIGNSTQSSDSVGNREQSGKPIGKTVTLVSSPSVRLRLCRSATSAQGDSEQALAFPHSPTGEWAVRSPHPEGPLRSTSRMILRQKSKPPAKTTPKTPMERPADLSEFARWLKGSLRCRLLMRTNFSDERGLPAGGSYSDFFSRWGVPQIDLPFKDGTAPTPSIAHRAVEHVEVFLQTTCIENASGAPDCDDCQAVVVHCKSGLGRSMSVLGALAVSLSPGLSGAAYFGWARLVRPGAIQTAEQERFLRALDEDREGGDCSCCMRRPFGGQALVKDIKKDAKEHVLDVWSL